MFGESKGPWALLEGSREFVDASAVEGVAGVVAVELGNREDTSERIAAWDNDSIAYLLYKWTQ